jgi:prepilin-type N-terminal cleavage/methylation domain-containing protein
METNMTSRRGMTIIEMIISLAIMLLVLGFATALFKQAYAHNTLTGENMTNEQLTRVAMAKINNSIAQASEDTNELDTGGGTPAPPVIVAFPAATSTPAIVFYRVQALAPAAGLPIGSGNQPNPAYYVHIISYDGAGTVNEYVTPVANYTGLGPSPPPIVLATDVTDFQVQQVNGNQLEYRLSLTINHVENKVSGVNAELPYTLVDNVHIMQ